MGYLLVLEDLGSDALRSSRLLLLVLPHGLYCWFFVTLHIAHSKATLARIHCVGSIALFTS